MIKTIICSVKELDTLKNLHAVAQQATREFQVAFTMACYARDEHEAQFVGFDPSGVVVMVKDPDPPSDGN